ncbi:hypothetical protein BDAP_000965 [Binucleata daphniae]
MSFISKDTQITESGTALPINTMASTSLSNLFAPSLGPFGTLKMLISSSLSVSKDGTTLCKEIQFTHPFSIIVTKSALNLSQMLGDGSLTFVLLCCELFNNSVKHKDTSLHKIIAGLQKAMQDTTKYLNTIKLEINKENIEKIITSSLKTKIDDADIFASFIMKAFENIQDGNNIKTVDQNNSNAYNFLDTNMIEIIKMPEGDPQESMFVEGLVLDHGPRHPQMPTKLTDCYIMIASISLEYEKPEINAQFNYKSAEQRDLLVASERKFIFERAQEIAKFAEAVKQKTGKNLVLINEKGIDPISLEVLSNANVLALRRAKRRNMERIVKMCGGSVISRIDQLDVNMLGYCKNVKVKSFGDEKYTFIEGTPFKGSCTILVKGNTSFEIDRIICAIKGAIKSLGLLQQEKVCLKGGVFLYAKLYKFLNEKIREVDTENVVGYKVLRNSIMNIAKVLVRNQDKNVEEAEISIERDEYADEGIIDNYSVVSRILSSACILTTNLLMVDDIIKAGKTIKEEKNEEK